jgi:hypothetical protein
MEKLHHFGTHHGLMERKPKNIALLFMRLPKRKRDAPWHKPFIRKGWVTNIKMDASLTIPIF